MGDLVKVLRVPQPKASRHLAYLRKSGLVMTRREALWSYYRLAPAKSVLHRDLLRCLQACSGTVPTAAQDAARLKAVERSGGCCPR